MLQLELPPTGNTWAIERDRLCYSYVMGVQWTLFYYYQGWACRATAARGCRARQRWAFSHPWRLRRGRWGGILAPTPGVPSWSWFYPAHYPPVISDVVKYFTTRWPPAVAAATWEAAAREFVFPFELSAPFQPFQQLVAVLPPSSSALLPAPYRPLLVSPTSPLADSFPRELKVDRNDKANEWEAVVLLPFIDQSRLVRATAPLEQLLTPAETERNRLKPAATVMVNTGASAAAAGASAGAGGGRGGPPLQVRPYVAAPPRLLASRLATFDAVRGLDVRWRARAQWPPSYLGEVKPLRAPYAAVVRGPQRRACQRTESCRALAPGFPTLRLLPFSAQLKHAGLTVFDMPAKGASMVLTLPEEDHGDTSELASAILFSRCAPEHRPPCGGHGWAPPKLLSTSPAGGGLACAHGRAFARTAQVLCGLPTRP